jgi:hypothetical protein
MQALCTATDCALSIQPVFVGSSVTAGTQQSVGNYLGTPAFTNALEERRGFIAMHDSAEMRAVLLEFDPFDAADQSVTVLPSAAETLGGTLLLECENVVGLAESTEQVLRGVSLQGGTSSVQDLMRGAQALHFEPFAARAIAPFSPDPANTMPVSNGMNGPEGSIDAFSITGNGVSAPSIVAIPDTEWQPPNDLSPLTLTVRTPVAFECD